MDNDNQTAGDGGDSAADQAVDKVLDKAGEMADKTSTTMDDQVVQKAGELYQQHADKVPGLLDKLKNMFSKK